MPSWLADAGRAEQLTSGRLGGILQQRWGRGSPRLGVLALRSRLSFKATLRTGCLMLFTWGACIGLVAVWNLTTRQLYTGRTTVALSQAP